MTAALARPTAGRVHAAFLRQYPRFAAHATFAFRHMRSPTDQVAEALAWGHFAALHRRGRRPEQFVTTLALRYSQAARGRPPRGRTGRLKTRVGYASVIRRPVTLLAARTPTVSPAAAAGRPRREPRPPSDHPPRAVLSFPEAL